MTSHHKKTSSQVAYHMNNEDTLPQQVLNILQILTTLYLTGEYYQCDNAIEQHSLFDIPGKFSAEAYQLLLFSHCSYAMKYIFCSDLLTFY